MTVAEFRNSLQQGEAPDGLPVTLAALWYDAKGDWERAHGLVDELETAEGMAVHAYLHRKQGDLSNAAYWYGRAGRQYFRPELPDEWLALAEALLPR